MTCSECSGVIWGLEGEVRRNNKLRVVRMVTRRGGSREMREILVEDPGQKVRDWNERTSLFIFTLKNKIHRAHPQPPPNLYFLCWSLLYSESPEYQLVFYPFLVQEQQQQWLFSIVQQSWGKVRFVWIFPNISTTSSVLLLKPRSFSPPPPPSPFPTHGQTISAFKRAVSSCC